MFALKEIIQHYPHENSKALNNLQEQLSIFVDYLNDLTNNSKIIVNRYVQIKLTIPQYWHKL